MSVRKWDLVMDIDENLIWKGWFNKQCVIVQNLFSGQLRLYTYSCTRKLIDKSTKEIYDHAIFLQYLFIMSFHFLRSLANFASSQEIVSSLSPIPGGLFWSSERRGGGGGGLLARPDENAYKTSVTFSNHLKLGPCIH